MSESHPHVFTIPPSAPFLTVLAQALVDGRLIEGFRPKDDPLSLSEATIYLPTRRAARAFGFALIDALGTEALILPKILPLGDVDEDERAFDREGDDELLPAISSTGRRLVLAQLVLQWAQQSVLAGGRSITTSPAVSLALADELARVLDDLTIAGIPLDRLNDSVPQDLDEYWEISRSFLNIVREAWPAILRERSQLDPTARRETLLRQEAEGLAKNSGGGPVIAAGSTGSLPSVAHLLSVIARRKDGAVILPGLDQLLEEDSFSLIGDNDENDSAQGHPQFGLQRLLSELNVRRSDVITLSAPSLPAREKMLSETFRPAVVTERWTAGSAENNALDGVTLVEAADSREEALAIAISLREAIERKTPRTALVTPDRALARRVAAELTRWGIRADDSAGLPLSESEAGRFARLVADATSSQLAPIELLALLRHPFARFIASESAVDALEQGVLRGPRPAPGFTGLLHAIEHGSQDNFHRNDPRARLQPEDWQAARKLCEHLREALDPLCGCGETAHSLHDVLRAHQDALQRLGLDLDDAMRPDCEALAETFRELSADPGANFFLTLSDYAGLFGMLLLETTLRPPRDETAPIHILGPIEARLVSFDHVVLGGLNEGTWPAGARTDAFLNRPMRRKLGLNLPERQIGLSAHDFVQLLGNKNVIVTRARREGGAETVASRSWQRMAAVAGEKVWRAAIARGDSLLQLARRIDRPREEPHSINRPEPRPPSMVRPQQLAVTDIEHLVRDPYTIYAKHILKIFPLEPIDADPGVAERGIILHDALALFVEDFPKTLPSDALEQLLARGRNAFTPYRDFPSAEAVWWPRFVRVAEWFIGAERLRRRKIESLQAEIRGKLSFTVDGFPFTLTAKADRIERWKDKSVAILDYKSGTPPTLSQVITGLAPQLPLEAAIAREGGFPNIAKGARIGEIAVFRLSGGNPPGEFISLDPAQAEGQGKKAPEKYKIESCDGLADFALARLKALIAHYANEKNPYLPIPRPKWRGRYGEYDHLARIKEWSDGGGGE